MASLALTRPVYLQEGKISPATDLYPVSSLTDNLTALTLSFSRKKNCYLTSHFHSWIRCGLFSTAWDTALHSKGELLLRAQSIISTAESSNWSGCQKLRDSPLHEGALPSLPRKQTRVPYPLSCTLSPLIWTVAVRDEDNPFTLWASQEKTVLWLIPGDQPRKGKETQTSI